MGFYGGQRNRAAYFVATVREANSFLGLDPHRVEDVSPSNTTTSIFPSDSFLASQHSGLVSDVNVAKLDPCISLGFYFRNRALFQAWCSKQQQKKENSPLFSVETFTAVVGAEPGSPTSDASDDEGFVIV